MRIYDVNELSTIEYVMSPRWIVITRYNIFEKTDEKDLFRTKLRKM